MHIAICFWGLLRSLQFTIDNIHEQILLPLNSYGHTYDIYIHTYQFRGTYNSTRNNEANVVVNTSNWQLLHPQYIYIEDQDAFDQNINYELYESKGDPWHNQFGSFKNHMRALNSLYHVTKVLEAVTSSNNPDVKPLLEYDAVIFARPDVHFLNPLPVQLLSTLPLRETTGYEKPVLFLSDFHRSCNGKELNDRFAMGSLSAALIYGKKLEKAYEYSMRHPLHAEKFTHDHLTKSSLPTSSLDHIKLIEIPFRFRRVRTNGDFHHRDYEIIAPEQQQHYQQQGLAYTGKDQRTWWCLRWFYSLLELITFGQVYVWNHDDNGNLNCDPHHKLTLSHLQKLKLLYPPLLSNGTGREFGQSQSQSQRQHVSAVTIHCEVVPQSHVYGSGVSIFQVPQHCRVVNRKADARLAGQPVAFNPTNSSHQRVESKVNPDIFLDTNNSSINDESKKRFRREQLQHQKPPLSTHKSNLRTGATSHVHSIRIHGHNNLDQFVDPPQQSVPVQ
jgi:hypothetical protein